MQIKDAQGKYLIKVDLERYIVYEKNIGIWKKEDISRFQNEYFSKIIPMLEGKEWFKCCDLREYEPSDITKEIDNFVAWCVENGLYGGLIIVEDEVIEMQMNASAVYSNVKFSPIAFTDVEEAHKWLNSRWI